jgi:hypothetical protein
MIYGMASRLINRLFSPIDTWIERNPKNAEQVGWWIRYVAGTVPREGEEPVGVLERVAHRMLPPNWYELRTAQISRVKQLMAETGLCLAWVPRPEIVAELLVAENKNERDRVLLERAPEILDDLDCALELVDQSQLQAVRTGAERAVDAFRSGHESAAQALCVPLLSQLIEGHFQSFRQARKRLGAAEDPDPRAARSALVESVLAASICISYDLPPDGGFNRHTSAHRFDLEQFTPAHAIAAMMLTVGVLRELNDAYREAERDLPYYPTAIAYAVRVRSVDA